MAEPLQPRISKLAQPVKPGGVLGELQSEVSTEAEPLLDFMTRHAQSILYMLAVLVLAVLATALWQWHSGRAERAAQMELGRILTVNEGAPRLSELEAFLKEAPASLTTSVQLEIAREALRQEKPERAAEAFSAVHAGDPHGTLGFMAGVNQADVLIQAGKTAQALAVLDSLQDSLLKGDPAQQESRRPMLQAIRELQGAAAEQAGQPDRALEAYEAILKDSGGTDLGYYEAKVAALRRAVSGENESTGKNK